MASKPTTRRPRASRSATPAPPATPLWPADHVERWPIARLTAYSANARTHSPAQIDQIAVSMLEWGWTIPILATEDGTIIAGHARVAAATLLGYAEVPVMLARGWSEAKIAAYVIADNQLALNAGWDDEVLRAELARLAALDYNLLLTGFGSDDIEKLLRPDGLTDPDEVPPVPDTPTSRPGDRWRLGRHTLVCGDSTDPAAVTRALAGVRPNLMVTDPPYGVDYDPEWRTRAPGLWTTNGYVAPGRVENDGRVDWTDVWRLFPGDVAYVWHAGLHAAAVQQSLEKAGFVMRSQIIWAKPHPPISRGDYHWQHEPCWYAVRKGKPGHYVGGRKQSTLWQVNNNTFQGIGNGKGENARTGHGTQKPVECMRRAIENNSSQGQAVYDPFTGSFTTGIAAEMTGRSAHCLEINPLYVDVGILRWQNFTGQEALLTSENGEEPKPFAAVVAERAPVDQAA
jgi:DNA modification methylase